MRKAFVLIMTALVVAPAHAGTWSRTYGTTSSWDQVAWAGPAQGGGLWLVGSTDVLPGRFGDAVVLRLDDRGAIVSQLAYGSAEREELAGVAPTSDGGLLLCGAVTHAFVDRAGWVVKLDAAGAISWQHELALPGDFQVTTAFAACESSDGTYLVAGSTSEIDTPPRFGWVCGFDAAGALLFQAWHDAGGFGEYRAIVPTPDGGAVLAGTSPSPSGGGMDAWVVAVDDAGAPTWARTFGGASEDDAIALDRLPDGGFAFVGTTQSFTSSGRAPWLVRLDATGRTAWHRVFGDAEWGDAQAVTARPDGSLVVAGRLDFGGRPTGIDAWLAALDASGGPLWQRSIAGPQGDWSASVEMEADGSGLVLGAMSAWGFPEQEHWLLRTDLDGRIASCGMVADASVTAHVPAFDEVDSPVSDAPLRFDILPLAFTPMSLDESVAVQCDACADAGGVAPAEPSAGGAGQPPLRVRKSPAPQVVLEEVPLATAVNVHVDRIGSWYAPSSATGTECRVTAWTQNGDGTLTLDLDVPPGSWLVASASNACGESSSGRDSFLRERRGRGTWEACPLGP